MKKEYSIKTISIGFIKVIAFLASAHILRELSFVPIAAISAKYWSQYDGRGLNEPLFFSSTAAYMLATIIVCMVFLKRIDKKNWAYIRVDTADKLKLFMIGLLLSFVAVLVFASVVILSDMTEINLMANSFWSIILYLVFSFSFVFIAVLDEELLTRTYILKTLESHINPLFAIFFSSFLFSVLHIFNPNTSLIGFSNIFLMGVLLGVICIAYNSIWLPIGLHTGWNFLLILFDFPVSGRNFPNSVFNLEYKEYSFISGSKFGPEDSLFITCLIIILIGFFFIKFRRKLLDSH